MTKFPMGKRGPEGVSLLRVPNNKCRKKYHLTKDYDGEGGRCTVLFSLGSLPTAFVSKTV